MTRANRALVVVMLSGAALWACKKEQPATEAPAPAAPQAAAPAPAEPPAAEPAAQPEGKGTIEGEVALTGEAPQMQPLKRGADPVCNKGEAMDEQVVVKDGKLANVVVRVVGKVPGAAPLTGDVTLNQEQCLYRPRVQAAMKGQTLQIKNSDGTLHNVHAREGSSTWFNKAQPARAADITVPINKDGVVRFKCDVHPWMTAYIVLAENPFFATTGADGKFQLKDVPAGTYTLEAWHERFGVKKQEVTVTPDGTVNAAFSYAATDRI